MKMLKYHPAQVKMCPLTPYKKYFLLIFTQDFFFFGTVLVLTISAHYQSLIITQTEQKEYFVISVCVNDSFEIHKS